MITLTIGRIHRLCLTIRKRSWKFRALRKIRGIIIPWNYRQAWIYRGNGVGGVIEPSGPGFQRGWPNKARPSQA